MARRRCLIGGQIEAEAGGGDDLDVEGGEVDAGGEGDAVQALADDVQGVFGGVEEDAAGLGGREAAQAGGAGGDGEGEVEGEEGLAALGLAADDADGLRGPEGLDEPAALGRPALELHARGGWAGARSRAALGGGEAPGFAGDAGRGEDLEIELLVELRELALGGGGEQLGAPWW